MAVTWNGTTFPNAKCPTPSTWPTERKIIAYPGVDYVDAMDMGTRERTLKFRGLITDANGGGAQSLESLANLDTGAFATLADGVRTYPNCRLVGIAFDEPVDAIGGTFSGLVTKIVGYEAEFEQLRP